MTNLTLARLRSLVDQARWRLEDRWKSNDRIGCVSTWSSARDRKIQPPHWMYSGLSKTDGNTCNGTANEISTCEEGSCRDARVGQSPLDAGANALSKSPNLISSFGLSAVAVPTISASGWSDPQKIRK